MHHALSPGALRGNSVRKSTKRMYKDNAQSYNTILSCKRQFITTEPARSTARCSGLRLQELAMRVTSGSSYGGGGVAARCSETVSSPTACSALDCEFDRGGSGGPGAGDTCATAGASPFWFRTGRFAGGISDAGSDSGISRPVSFPRIRYIATANSSLVSRPFRWISARSL